MAQNLTPVLQIDGRLLYFSFLAGTQRILANQTELNRINYFPVNDGDTGSNMAATVRSVFETVRPHKSYKITIARIAEAALSNARGNSGIIFAQFLYGISNETAEQSSITLHQFADSVKRSVRYMYDAVANPVEGTMLTVIREWADYIYTQCNEMGGFGHLMINSGKVVEKSLEETRNKLEVLTRANVVDAGAKGFALFINGIIDLIKVNNIRQLIRPIAEAIILPDEKTHINEIINLRYCTEAILQHVAQDPIALKALLEKYGDSVVIAGSENLKHLHLHTDKPADFFNELRAYGTITFQKADDMLRQSDIIYRRRYNIALVTDSTCDLPQQMIDDFQIHVLPLHIRFGDNQYLDKLTLQPEQFYEMLEEGGDFPKTSQINEKSFLNLYSHLVSHYDSVIAVHLTEKFSGTFFNSQKAAQVIGQESGKVISVIDSKNLSGGLGLIVLRVAKAIQEGLSHEEIKELAADWVKQTKIYVSVKTLKYMVRGGRVSPIKGWIAQMLNVNPIVSMDENGKSMIFGKTYSQKSNMEMVMQHIRMLLKDRKIWKYIVLHADNPNAAAWYEEKMKALTGQDALSVVDISPVVGANAGIGAASVALMID